MIDELLHLLSDPAHLAFEVITDLAFGGVGVVWHALWVRRHDARRHPECPLDSHTAEELRYTVPGSDGFIPARPGRPVPEWLTGKVVDDHRA